ncbi:hypothetical protein FQN51_003702 [Onygenales sp. PD_10]|nr:hypothetical protein FQN51_003702 [Onygenales sp. PD_10]
MRNVTEAEKQECRSLAVVRRMLLAMQGDERLAQCVAGEMSHGHYHEHLYNRADIAPVDSPPLRTHTLKVSVPKAVSLTVTLAGLSFLNTMGSGILIAALPQIAKEPGITEDLVLWPAVVYALAAGCLVLLFVAIADVIGARLMWITGSFLFLIFAVAIGASRTGIHIVIFLMLLGAAISIDVSAHHGLVP